MPSSSNHDAFVHGVAGRRACSQLPWHAHWIGSLFMEIHLQVIFEFSFFQRNWNWFLQTVYYRHMNPLKYLVHYCLLHLPSSLTKLSPPSACACDLWPGLSHLGGDTRVEMVWLWRGRLWRGRWCLPFTQCTGVFLLLPDIGLLSNSGVSGMKVNAEVSARKWPQSVTGTAASGNWTKGRCSLGADLNPALIWGFLWNFPKAVTRNPANRQMLTCHSGIAFEWRQPTGVCVVWKWSLHPSREGRAPLVAFYRKPLVLVSVRSHILPGDLVV